MNDKQKLEYKEEKITSPINDTKTCFRVFTEPATDEHYLCMSSGYMASSNFKLEDDNFKLQMEGSPELVKALQHYDDERDTVWIPSVLNMGPLGMVFPDGNLENWHWKYAKNFKIGEDEKEKYPIPGIEGEYFESRLDVENAEEFDKNDFIGACTAMGIIKDGRIDASGASESAEA